MYSPSRFIGSNGLAAAAAADEEELLLFLVEDRPPGSPVGSIVTQLDLEPKKGMDG